MSDEPRITNGLNIRVHEFFTRPEPVKDINGKETGEIILRDYVKYGAPLAMDRSVTEARVERILTAPKPREGDANIAVQSQWLRKEYIQPRYEAWKKGEEIPEMGVPLAALNFLRADDVAILKRNGVRTAEELRDVLDANIDAIKLPDMRGKRLQAKRFIEAQDTNKAAAKVAASEALLAETSEELKVVKAQMAAFLAKEAETVDEPEVDENGDKLPKKRKTLGLPQQAA